MDEKAVSALSEESILQCMISRLAKFDIRLGDYPEVTKTFRRAAVLLPLTIRNGEIFLLLTKRANSLRTHPSTVSLPGGTRDETDVSDIDTALREAEEEIGLPQACVKVLAVLDRSITLPNILVYPVVGFIPSDFVPQINETEVQTAFYIPLKEFISPKVETYFFKMFGEVFRTHSLNYDNGEDIFVIWGFTAVQCVHLARIVYGQDVTEIRDWCRMYLNRVSYHVELKSKPKL